MIYNLLDPGILFTVVWLFAISLYLLGYSLLLLPMTGTCYLFFFASCAAFFLPSLMRYLSHRREPAKSKNDLKAELDIQSNTKLIFYAWLLLSVVEVIAAQNLPLLGIIGIGPVVRYTDFGIPSLHGLLNACLLVLSNYAFQRYLSIKDNKYILEWFLYLLWSIALLGRQLMLSQVLQSSFIFVYHRRSLIRSADIKSGSKISPKIFSAIRFFLIVGIFVTLFGSIGDSRQQSDHGSILEVAQVSPSFPAFLPSSLFWVYLYITSPLSNVIYNIGDSIDSIKPSYFPLSILSGILPSQLRDPIVSMITGEPYQWQLVVDYLNVSSFHQDFLLDFGVIGSIFVYLFLSIVAQRFYQKSLMSMLVCWRFTNVIILHNVVFSVFNNFFTNIAFIGQIVIHILLQYQKIKLQRSNSE